MKTNKKVLNLSLAAIFAAIVFLSIMVVHIPIGVNGGYIHLGDTMIYLCAVLLPTPYAVAASAIGAGFADLASGGAAWVVPSIIIKSLSVLFFTSKKSKILCARNYIALLTGAILCCGGYYIAEVIIYGCGFAVPLASVPMNLIQTGVSAVLFVALGVVFDKSGLKDKINNL